MIPWSFPMTMCDFNCGYNPAENRAAMIQIYVYSYASFRALIKPNTIPRMIAHAPIPMIEKK